MDVSRDGGNVVLRGRGPNGLNAPAAVLDAGNSGSTLRMIAGLLAGRPFRSVVTGDDSLRRRPVERVARPLRAMGARLEGVDGRPPLTIEGGRLSAIDWTLEVASAQVKTAILLAGLQAEGTTSVREPLPSRDHTERLLPLFGAPLAAEPGKLSVRGVEHLEAASLETPGDVSSAAFLVVAALILPDSTVRIDGVLLNPRRTAFLDVLRGMGARIETHVERDAPEPVGWIEARSSRLSGADVPPERIPALIDEVPILAVAGAFADGALRVSGASELRVKESDRISALVDALTAMGARAEERADGFVVEGGGRLKGASLSSCGDHRIAMAFAVAALAAEGDTQIEGGECAAVSFPEFYDLLESGARA